MYQISPLVVAICHSVDILLHTNHCLVGSGGMLDLSCIGHCCGFGWGSRNCPCWWGVVCMAAGWLLNLGFAVGLCLGLRVASRLWGRWSGRTCTCFQDCIGGSCESQTGGMGSLCLLIRVHCWGFLCNWHTCGGVSGVGQRLVQQSRVQSTHVSVVALHSDA